MATSDVFRSGTLDRPAPAAAVPSRRDERAARMERIFRWPVILAASAVIPVIYLEETDHGPFWKDLALALNWTIWVVFLVELVVMLAVVPKRGKWLLHHPLDVAIVVLTPPFLPVSLQAARALRLLRLFQFLPLSKVGRVLFTGHGVRLVAILCLMALLGGGAALAKVETKQDLSTWDGVWWAFTTMTTVGYGDIFPETDVGRMIAIFLMVAGIGFAAILTGALAQHFLRVDIRGEISDFEAAEDDVVREIAEISARLQRLEATVRRGGEPPLPGG